MTTELLKRLYMEQHIDARMPSISETQKGSAQTVPAEVQADYDIFRNRIIGLILYKSCA